MCPDAHLHRFQLVQCQAGGSIRQRWEHLLSPMYAGMWGIVLFLCSCSAIGFWKGGFAAHRQSFSHIPVQGQPSFPPCTYRTTHNFCRSLFFRHQCVVCMANSLIKGEIAEPFDGDNLDASESNTVRSSGKRKRDRTSL